MVTPGLPVNLYEFTWWIYHGGFSMSFLLAGRVHCTRHDGRLSHDLANCSIHKQFPPGSIYLPSIKQT